ncbi:hypothetical protein [Salinimonas profundi]|nr:hypothetical protein [Salinimonas profundi]
MSNQNVATDGSGHRYVQSEPAGMLIAQEYWPVVVLRPNYFF